MRRTRADYPGADMTPSQLTLAQHLITGLNLEGIGPADIQPDAPLFGEGLKLDSIDALELAVIIERSYGVRIADMDAGKKAFASLAALDAFIASQPPAAGGGPATSPAAKSPSAKSP